MGAMVCFYDVTFEKKLETIDISIVVLGNFFKKSIDNTNEIARKTKNIQSEIYN
ncbi:MAG: hypothetical protein ACTSRG_23130 [Candidatus Helarchaeota archaeon]